MKRGGVSYLCLSNQDNAYLTQPREEELAIGALYRMNGISQRIVETNDGVSGLTLEVNKREELTLRWVDGQGRPHTIVVDKNLVRLRDPKTI